MSFVLAKESGAAQTVGIIIHRIRSKYDGYYTLACVTM